MNDLAKDAFSKPFDALRLLRVKFRQLRYYKASEGEPSNTVMAVLLPRQNTLDGQK